MSKPPDRSQDLILAYLNGEATPEQLSELSHLLSTNPKSAEDLAIQAYLAVMLIEMGADAKFGEAEEEEMSSVMTTGTGTGKSEVSCLTTKEIDPNRALGDSPRVMREGIEPHSWKSLTGGHRTSFVRRGLRSKKTRIGIYCILAASMVLVFGLWYVLASQPTSSGRLVRRAPPQPADQSSRGKASKALAAHQNDGTTLFEEPSHAEPQSRQGPKTTSSPAKRKKEPSQPPTIPALPPVPQPTPPARVAEAPKPIVQLQPVAPEPTLTTPETERPIAHIAKILGPVMFARGPQGPWVQAVEGISLLASDRLDTRTGMVRLQIDGSSTVYAHKNTVLTLRIAVSDASEVTLVDMTRGEVYIADGKRKVHVLTRDGLYSPVGTRFDIKQIRSATIVAVERGAVRAQARAKRKLKKQGGKAAKPSKVDLRRFEWVKQAVRVEAGNETRVRRGAVPTAPQAFSRTRLGWIARLSPELSFAGRQGGALLYSLRFKKDPPHQALQIWSYPIGGRWVIRDQPARRDALDPRRLLPDGPTVSRTHAVLGMPSWKNYEVVLAFRMLPGRELRRTEGSCVYAIAYQGARASDLYRFRVGPYRKGSKNVRIVRNFDSATKNYVECNAPFAVKIGKWYRLRFAVRADTDRTFLSGKVWPAALREPAAWTLQTTDTSNRHLKTGRAGVGMQNLQAEVVEFAVHELISW